MPSRFAILGAAVLLGFLLLPCSPSNAAEPPPEDHNSFWDYRLVGDRILLKNPLSRVEYIPSVYNNHGSQGPAWWGDDIRLTYYDTTDALCPSVASKDSYLHIAWMHWGPGLTARVFYKRSCDLGRTWDEDVQISNAPEEVNQGSPDMTLSTSCLHAVWGYTWKPIWEQGHIYYRRSTDNGETWEDVYFLSSYDQQSKPSIAVLGDTVYVVFTRTIDRQEIYELHFRKSYDEGATWTEDCVITDYGPSLIRGTLCANEEGLHYVFNHKDNFDEPGNPYRSQEVFYIHSPDWGTTWTDPAIVSHRDSIHSQWPSMCLDDEGAIHVTWFDYKTSPYSETGDIFYTNSTDNGQTWSEIQVLTDAHSARFSNIIASGDHLYLVWEDWRDGYDQGEIYFRHSPDRGESWDPEERLTYASNDSYTPVITEKACTLYVVWEDSRHDPTNVASELYFKRGGFETISIKKPAFAEHALYLSSHPNPFNEKVVIRYRLAGSPGPQRASLKIYNIRGQVVKVLLDEELIAGKYQIVWDGTDCKETKISSGVYLCVLQVGESRSVAPLLFLK